MSEVNQCDGCLAGKPVDENGNHEMCDGDGAYSDLMACQKKKYQSDSDYGTQPHPNRITRGARPK